MAAGACKNGRTEFRAAGLSVGGCPIPEIFRPLLLDPLRISQAQKSSFARTTRPGHNNCRKVSSCVQQHVCQSSLDILHMRNINCHFRLLNTRNLWSDGKGRETMQKVFLDAPAGTSWSEGSPDHLRSCAVCIRAYPRCVNLRDLPLTNGHLGEPISGPSVRESNMPTSNLAGHRTLLVRPPRPGITVPFLHRFPGGATTRWRRLPSRRAMGAAEWRNFSAGVGASAPEIMRRAFRQGPSRIL